MLSKFRKWLFRKPNQNNFFGVNFRETLQSIKPHKCSEWEHRVEPGEEEHGKNYYKRYCVVCDKVQILMFHRYGNIRTEWVDEIRSSDIKLS